MGKIWASCLCLLPLSLLAAGKPMLCPSVNAVTLNAKSRLWSAPGGWHSYDTSFANTLTKYLGAQWNGVVVGQVTCLYQPADNNSLPIMLYYNKLVFEPKTSTWSANMGGYRNCHQAGPADCPFFVRVAPVNHKSLMQQLRDLKQTPGDSNIGNEPF